MRNWGALVDDPRQGLVRWMRKYLTELTRAAIYRVLRRWRPIWRNHAGGRERGVSHRGDLPWRSLVMSYGGHWAVTTTCDDVVRCPKAWRNRGEWCTSRWRPLGHVVDASGWVTERNSAPKFIHGKIFSPREVIRVLLGANRSADANPSAGLPATRCTAPWGTIRILIRAPDRATSEVFFINFCVATP
jgi:hypothetical protein